MFILIFLILLVVFILVKIRQLKIEFRKSYGNVVVAVGGSGVGKTLFITYEGLKQYNRNLGAYRLECFKVWFHNWFFAPYLLKEYPKKPLLYSNYSIYDRRGKNVISTPIERFDIINFTPLIENSVVCLSELSNWFNQDFYKDVDKDLVTKWFSQQRHLFNCNVFCDVQEEDMLFNGIRRSRSDLIYLLEGRNLVFNRKLILCDYTTNVFERDEYFNVTRFVRTVPKRIFRRYDSRFNKAKLKALINNSVKPSTPDIQA